MKTSVKNNRLISGVVNTLETVIDIRSRIAELEALLPNKEDVISALNRVDGKFKNDSGEVSIAHTPFKYDYDQKIVDQKKRLDLAIAKFKAFNDPVGGGEKTYRVKLS